MTCAVELASAGCSGTTIARRHSGAGMSANAEQGSQCVEKLHYTRVIRVLVVDTLIIGGQKIRGQFALGALKTTQLRKIQQLVLVPASRK